MEPLPTSNSLGGVLRRERRRFRLLTTRSVLALALCLGGLGLLASPAPAHAQAEKVLIVTGRPENPENRQVISVGSSAAPYLHTQETSASPRPHPSPHRRIGPFERGERK